MTKPTTLKMMDTSTGHLSVSTRNWLERAENREKRGFMARDTGYAMSTYLGAEGAWKDEPDLPPDLAHILRFAHANNFDWILFDVDAERDLNLPWYEDTYGKPELPEGLDNDLLKMHVGPRLWAIDAEKISDSDLVIKQQGDAPIRELEDENYVIPHRQGAWIEIAGVAMRIYEHDWGVQVSSFISGYEMDGLLGSMELYADEIKEARAESERAREEPEP
jgi:hypothetical protein